MRIAQVAPLVESVPPAKYGGTERVIAALTAELIEMGHQVTLYASGDSVTEARLIPLVERALWRSDTKANELLLHFAELGRVTREARNYDIIHSHLDCMAFPFGRFSPTPIIHTLHGRLDLPELRRLYWEFPETPVVSISNSQRAPIPFANYVATVYNGVPLEKLPFGEGKGGYLAFVGRISPEKGIADAIDVAQRAGIPLKIAARMPLPNVDNPWVAKDWEYYRDEVKPRLNGSLVEFVGEVDDEEKGKLLKDALALLFPINWPEPFGLAMAEALACGTPVLARSMGSVPEVVDHGHTGFLCADVDEMVAYCQSIESIDRYACRREAEERFSARAMAKGYLQAYSAVREKRPAPAVRSVKLFGPSREAVPTPA
jgi:glycosyltransferase involved in cell wall biosynthesis